MTLRGILCVAETKKLFCPAEKLDENGIKEAKRRSHMEFNISANLYSVLCATLILSWFFILNSVWQSSTH